jgi:hypothetical protein
MTSDSASRVTRSRRSLQRALFLAAAVLAGVTALRAQETPPATAPAGAPAAAVPEADAPPASAKEPAREQAGSPAAAANSGDPGEPKEAPAPADAKAGGKVAPTRDRFEPTEKVRADFDVSFPVDI